MYSNCVLVKVDGACVVLCCALIFRAMLVIVHLS